ncbi:MAG: hypothetical protein ACP5E8_00610 [Thermoplasmata archaeon]
MKKNAILMVALLAMLSVQIPMAHGQLMNSSITALATTSANSTQIIVKYITYYTL